MRAKYFLPACALAAGLSVFAAGLRPQQPYTIRDHGLECETKIGKIRPFSCLDGQLIPITKGGVPLAPGTFTDDCDRPSFLGPAYCNPYARIGRLPNLDKDGNPDNDVQNIFICRRYNRVTDPADPLFKDVAIIQHRKSTGATCFFQHLDSFKDATRVPPPSEPASSTPVGRLTAEAFWLPPGGPQGAAAIGCNNCHDIGPFIHSPYVNQVKITVGSTSESIVYPLPDKTKGEKQNYRFVGLPFQPWGIPELIDPEDNKCTSCHILGTKSSSGAYTLYSTGRSRPTQITDSHFQYPNSHWMPPEQAGEMPQANWDALYKKSVDQIQGCHSGNTMMQPDECRKRPFGP